MSISPSILNRACASSESSPTERRQSSCVTRAADEIGGVYIKQYLHGNWDATSAVVERRTAREADLLDRLSKSGRFSGRLGVMEIVRVEPREAMIVTREVSGRALEQAINSRERAGRSTTAALVLAGRWLAEFQKLSLSEDDRRPISTYDPEDLVEYCEIRLSRLREHDELWFEESTRLGLVRTLRRLVSDCTDTDKRFVWSHGDYSPGNIIWDGCRLTPIDFAMAHPERPLLDVTYFVHRLEMLSVYRPWKRWPIQLWRRAMLRGYGRPNAEQSPIWRALMIRHLLCRLLTYVRRPPRDAKQAMHDRWVRWYLRRRLIRIAEHG